MSYTDFKDIDKTIPASDGYYQWKSYFGIIDVIYQKGVWFLKSNKQPLGENCVKRWR
jgi:hypothetical protein